jgi:monovalent cation:H+ antiporter-2, CPA2 family
MPHGHDLPLLGAMAVGLGLAFFAGLLAVRLRLPALVGYLAAGIAIGPFTPGFVADPGIAAQLAEIGVILLMFGVGMHFSLRELWSVRRIALPGALAQIVVATGLGMALASTWGWSRAGGVVFGLCLSVASTVVILRAFQDRGYLGGQAGRIAIGWLIVEDLVMVLALLLVPVLAGAAPAGPGGAGVIGQVALALGKIAVFFALLYGVGVRVLPWLFGQLLRTGSRELLTLFVTVAAVSIAYGAAQSFGVSLALGAFLAGVVVNEAGLGTRIPDQAQALEHVFTVLFFVSVGMLFDPAVVTERPLDVLAVLGVVVVGKSLAAFAIVRALGYSTRTGLTVSASLAQIGEFSFILAGLAVATGLLEPLARDLILAVSLISIALNPFAFQAVLRLAAWHERGKPASGAPDPRAVAAPRGKNGVAPVVVVGYGRVGRRVCAALRDADVPVTVVDFRREIVEELRRAGVPAVHGEGAMDEVLGRAGIGSAGALVLAGGGTREMDLVHEAARRARADLPVLRRAGAGEPQVDAHTQVFHAEQALGGAMAAHLLGAQPASPLGRRGTDAVV